MGPLWPASWPQPQLLMLVVVVLLCCVVAVAAIVAVVGVAVAVDVIVAVACYSHWCCLLCHNNNHNNNNWWCLHVNPQRVTRCRMSLLNACYGQQRSQTYCRTTINNLMTTKLTTTATTTITFSEHDARRQQLHRRARRMAQSIAPRGPKTRTLTMNGCWHRPL